MELTLLKRIFQEKAAITKLLSEDSLTVSDEQMLLWLQGDAQRLDQLIREGIFQRKGQDIGPGPMLLLLADVSEGVGLSSMLSSWRQTWRAVKEVAENMSHHESDPPTRNSIGAGLGRQLFSLRWRTQAFLSLANRREEMSLLSVAEEWRTAATELAGLWLMNPSHPEWEQLQRLLTEELNDGARVLEEIESMAAPDARLEKVRRLRSLRREQLETNTNISDLSEGEIPFLMLHKQLGIVTNMHPGPSLANDELNDGTEVSFVSDTLPEIPRVLDQWAASGQHLFQFLSDFSATRQLSPQARMAIMAGLIRDNLDQIRWQKAADGRAWEAYYSQEAS